MNKKELQKARSQIIEKIEKSKNFCILVSDPDTDAVGSGLAMEEILGLMGKESKLYSSFELDKFKYLPRFEKFIIKDISSIDFSQFECLIVLDSAEIHRLIDRTKGQKLEKFPKGSFVINIDHHDSNTMFADINYVPKNPIISCTSEALYDIFADKVKITKSLATNLLASIVGDTASFMYNSGLSPHLFRITAVLLEKGAKHRKIIYKTFYSYDPEILKMNFEVLNNFEIKKVGKYTYSYTYLDMDKYNLTDVNRYQVHFAKEMLRSMEGVDFGVFARSNSKNETKLSLRSRKVEISKLAEKLGGGGHREAAGAPMDIPLKEALQKMEKLLKTIHLKELKNI